MRKSNGISKLIYASIASLVILIIFFGISEIFKVRIINTNARLEDMEGFPPLGKKYIFNVSESLIKQYFLKNPQVEEVEIEKKLPNTLVIKVNYRTRLAHVLAENGMFNIDEKGLVFEKIASSSSLPLIHLETKKINLNTNITQNNLKLVLSILKQSNLQNLKVVDVISHDDETVSFTTSEGIEVIAGFNLKAEDIVSSLQMIIRRFTIEGKLISKIDFRFDKPVITFK